MPLYTKPPLFVNGSSGLVYSGMLQNIRGLEHAPLSEAYQKLDKLTNLYVSAPESLKASRTLSDKLYESMWIYYPNTLFLAKFGPH